MKKIDLINCLLKLKSSREKCFKHNEDFQKTKAV